MNKKLSFENSNDSVYVSMKCRIFELVFLYCFCQIGSSPGFEDGGFESAELMRPAGSVYHADEDCLYFADSEVFI